MSQQPVSQSFSTTDDINMTSTTSTSATVPTNIPTNPTTTTTTSNPITYNGVSTNCYNTLSANYSTYGSQSDYTTSSPYHQSNTSDYYYHNHHYDYDAYNTTSNTTATINTTPTVSAPTTPGYHSSSQSAYGSTAATNPQTYSSSVEGYIAPESTSTVYSTPSQTTTPYLVAKQQQCVDFKTELYLDNSSVNHIY